MKLYGSYAIAVALVMASSAAYADYTAGQQPAAMQSMGANAGQTATTADFGKLSKDGALAMQDVTLARIAIFNGQTADAKKYIDAAQSAMASAKTDNTSFMKAEADMKVPSGMTQRGSGAAASTTPVSWIPVDGTVTIGEDYTSSPKKTASVAQANQQLKNGQKKQAMQTLKLADVDVISVLVVAPLNATTNGIDQAAQLIDSGKYYEANQALKGVEDGLRYDVEDIDALPKKAGGMASGNAPAAASTMSPGTTATK